MSLLKKLFLIRKESFLALVLGAVSALAMPPYCAFPILFLTLPLMIYIFINAPSQKKAFLYGWLFGLGYFVFGLYWISNAIIEDFPYFVPFAILGLPMFLSIYTGLTGAITKWASKYLSGILLVMAFAVIFSIMEIARGFIFTGFPWNLTAYTWTNYLSVMQGIHYFGIYDFSFISILLFSLPYLFIERRKKSYVDCTPPLGGSRRVEGDAVGGKTMQNKSQDTPLSIELRKSLFSWTLPQGESAISCKSAAITFNLIGLAFLITLAVVGNARVKDNMQTTIFNKQVLFIQPSVPLSVSNLDSMHVFYEYIKMTEESLTDEVDIIVWGETAIPFAINRRPIYLDMLEEIIPDGVTLLTGSIRLDEENRYYNSVLAINSDGEIVGEYDKSHLVPFGEYMPLEEYINLEKIVGFDFVFSKGQGRKTIKVDGVPSFSPLVCYEIIFPGEVIDKDNKPEFIFNVSNDTFYGISSGPYQHLGMAQAQAIATGLPIIRVGNNGVSAVITSVGEVQDYIELGARQAKIIEF